MLGPTAMLREMAREVSGGNTERGVGAAHHWISSASCAFQP
jgi:hypothetical protein